MKFFSYVLCAGVLLAGSSILACDEKGDVSQLFTRDESGEYSQPTTWYDRADLVIEEFAHVTQSLYLDAAMYRAWTQKINDVIGQLVLQEQLQSQFLEQVQAAIEASIQKIREFEARRQADILQAKQEQFDVDGQKAMELIEVVEELKRDFSRIVIPERETLFLQLERFTHYLKEQMQRNALQTSQVIQSLQEHAQAVSGQIVPVA